MGDLDLKAAWDVVKEQIGVIATEIGQSPGRVTILLLILFAAGWLLKTYLGRKKG